MATQPSDPAALLEGLSHRPTKDRSGGLKVVEAVRLNLKEEFKMEKRYYLAYGSNLNVRQMMLRCPDARPIGTAVIPGYRLMFKGSQSGSYLTIEDAPGMEVPVGVWEVSERDELALDRYEGYPHFYYKKEISLPIEGLRSGKVRACDAFVYIMHEERPLGVPSLGYLQTCLAGYKHFGFDPEHLFEAYAYSRTEG